MKKPMCEWITRAPLGASKDSKLRFVLGRHYADKYWLAICRWREGALRRLKGLPIYYFDLRRHYGEKYCLAICQKELNFYLGFTI